MRATLATLMLVVLAGCMTMEGQCHDDAACERQAWARATDANYMHRQLDSIEIDREAREISSQGVTRCSSVGGC
jgi:hypothetical protein